MTEWLLKDRSICVVLMAAAGTILSLRLRQTISRTVWLGVLILGIMHALVLVSQKQNLLNNNLIHHYIGAKYAVPYGDYYKAVQAGLNRPQVAIMDLDRPPAMLRATTTEQRAYYIDLLRRLRITFDPTAPLEELAARARDSGAIRYEADSILASVLPASRIETFRTDVARAADYLYTTDYGFNGSPFYSLLRQADPMLHRPFGSMTGWVNLVFQMALALLLAWAAGGALALRIDERLAVAALLFASWDFVGYALSGLVFGEVWLPVALAALAMRRRNAIVAGAAIAWAGLLKLFPLLLTLPALLWLARPPREQAGERRWSLLLLGSAGVFTVILGGIAPLSGRSWNDFLHKVSVEFAANAQLSNSVSVDAELLTIGIHHGSLLGRIIAIVALAILGAMLLSPPKAEEGLFDALSRRCLILIAATGWFVHNWLNYYAIVPLLLLPWLAREHRVGAAAAALAMAVSFALPDFGDPSLASSPALHALKLLPYVCIPIWLVTLELPRRVVSGKPALIVIALLALATAGEAWRMAAIRRFDRLGQQLLDAGNPREAAAQFRSEIRLEPGDGRARMNAGISLAELGSADEALQEFRRGAELEPDDPVIQDNYGRALMLEERWADADARLQKALALTPNDPQVLMMLAELRLRQSRRPDAIRLLARARELSPEDPAIAAALRQLTGP